MKKAGRPNKIESIDKSIRKRLILELYHDGVNAARIARIFKMPLPNVSVILKNGTKASSTSTEIPRS